MCYMHRRRMRWTVVLGFGIVVQALTNVVVVRAFLTTTNSCTRCNHHIRSSCRLENSSNDNDNDKVSQGLVSILTRAVNAVATTPSTTTSSNRQRRRPKSLDELKDRLAQDYTVQNYLWTGQLDLECFANDCTFTDPTLSFVGTETYQRNIQNLVPWVERLCSNTQSILLDISINPKQQSVQTKWNMVGDVSGLPWKPKINVVGQTTFWTRPVQNDDDDGDSDGIEVYFYDESWEIPAAQALIQLITPGSTT